MKKNHKIIKTKIVTPELKQGIAKMGKRSSFARKKLLKRYRPDKQTPRKTAPFHMYSNFVPRYTLGNYDGGKWNIRNDPGARTDAWNLLKNRSVLLETKLKSEAIREAKKLLCSPLDSKPQKRPQPPRLESHRNKKILKQPSIKSGSSVHNQNHRKYARGGRMIR
uniref:Uncharacterized protein n=1 Tax=Aplanochytrium stocchinoi TaxID=215587 RepID=A0A6S8FKQ8_9STRA|mmetsp:Transcript_17551/g.21601  ORF Transcript_17551/g.21601 Transcript_17551/m.21601 type:complete len:165 (+) Transcript_17551:228-722(+)